jgi:ATP-dependent Clp protease ATP-binding subunit ClpA
MDAANMLKPALVRGEFRVIGATTSDEYERWICGDPALERRFQKVLVRELSSEQTIEILLARQARLELHHNVVIAESAIRAAVELTDIWWSDRVRPDRAIDALDEACAHTQAVAQYSERAETLIRARRRRERERPISNGSAPHRRFAEPDLSPDELEEEDPLGRMARDGFAALERFGAEIEAMFGTPGAEGVRAAAPAPGAPAAQREPTTERARPEPEEPATGSLDAELARVLTEEGIVVRGHDIARVVGLATGSNVTWAD